MSDYHLSDLISQEAHQFYSDHAQDDISKLLFKYAKDDQKKNWIQQLDSRLRAKKKLPSWYVNTKIIFPPKRNLEQASSELTALHKASLVNYKTSLDLTAGTGVDSWAFALRSKAHKSVEFDSDLTELITHNFSALEIFHASALNQSAEAFLEQNEDKFDLVFIDPSRRAKGGKKVILLEEYGPNIIDLENQLLAIGKAIMVKVSPMVDLGYLQTTFAKSIRAIHVVAVQNEVKEVLFILHQEPTELQFHATNLQSDNCQLITFVPEERNDNYMPAEHLGKYIYEPNAAVLKTGFFNSLCKRYGVKKLDQHSHLYTSEEKKDDFPGFCYRIVEKAAPYKLKSDISNASIISRNFPQKPESIRKRLKVKDGNAFRIFATTLNGKKIFILGEAIANN